MAPPNKRMHPAAGDRDETRPGVMRDRSTIVRSRITMARMRGDDRQPDSMFSYVSAEQRVPTDHPLRAIRALVDDVLRDMSREFDGLYARVGPPVDSARAAAAGAVAADLLLDSQRAAADGAARLQPAVSLVRRPGRWTSRSGRRRSSPRIATGC